MAPPPNLAQRAARHSVNGAPAAEDAEETAEAPEATAEASGTF